MAHTGPIEVRLAELEARLAKQAARIEALEAENRELRARLKQSSRNSSKPPSSDPPWMTPKSGDKDRNKKRKKRKKGGQPGHDKHSRPLVPTENVDKVKRVRPTDCKACSSTLTGRDPQPRRHQVWDLPEIKPNITEYQLEGLTCRCG